METRKQLNVPGSSWKLGSKFTALRQHFLLFQPHFLFYSRHIPACCLRMSYSSKIRPVLYDAALLKYLGEKQPRR